LEDRLPLSATVAGFDSSTLAATDDGSTGQISLPFTINFFGVSYDHLWVNNNGNVTFNGVLTTYTPFGLTSNLGTPIIAPFFADVDTRGSGSGVVTYGAGTIDGHSAFGVNYPNVGYYFQHADKLSSFQLLIIDRPDIGTGPNGDDFDIEFNYDQIQWETGDAPSSGGSGGLGGNSAVAGYSNGTGEPNTSFQIDGSAVNGGLLDTNSATGLIHNSFNSDTPGRFIFFARNGTVIATHDPVVQMPGAQTIAEGSLLDLANLVSFTDADTSDTHTATVDWGDGSHVEDVSVQEANGTGILAASHRYADNGVHTVSATVVDDSQRSGSGSFQVTIQNVAPQLINVTGDTIDENGVAAVTASVNDPGTADTFSVDVNWQDGAADTVPGLGSIDSNGVVGGTTYKWTAATRQLRLEHQYLDDDPTGTTSDEIAVTLKVHDDDLDESGPYTAVVTVNNIRPILVVADDQTVSEGQLLDLGGNGAPILGLLIDSGTRDTHTATVDWGDGSGVEMATISEVAGSGAVLGSHRYRNEGTYTVKVVAKDDDGGVSDVGTFEVSVSDVAPTLVNLVGSTIEENGIATVTAMVNDPGLLDTFEVDVNWQDGGSTDHVVGLGAIDASGTFGGTSYQWTAATRQLQLRHLYLDDGPSPGNGIPADVSDVALTVIDNAGKSTDSTADVNVKNVKPVVSAAADQIAVVGQLLDLNGPAAPNLGSFNDVGTLDGHTATVDWGDDSAVEAAIVTEANGSGTLGGHHIYAAAGSFTVKLTVKDDDGGVSDVQSFLVQVNASPPAESPPVVDVHAIHQSQIIVLGESISLGGLIVTDPDSTMLREVRVQLNPVGPVALGALKIVGPLPSGIHASIDAGGILSLTPTSGSVASLAEFQEALQQLDYQPTAAFAKPTAAVTFTVTVTDDTGLPGSLQILVGFKTVENPESPPVFVSGPPVVMSNATAAVTQSSPTTTEVASLGLEPVNTSVGSGNVIAENNESDSPEHAIAAERALQALLSSPHFARREEVIDAVHSLGDIELVSLLGVDMGDEPVFASKKQDAPQERVVAKPIVPSAEPAAVVATVESESGWKPLAFWSALAGGGTLWLGGTWWWNGRHRQNRVRSRKLPRTD
jgi:PKD repeat protein